MKCLNQYCDAKDIEHDDNFCYKCGYWTAKGYSFIKDKDNINMIMNGEAAKKDDSFSLMIGIATTALITFTVMCIIRGNNLFKPFFYLKRQTDSYIYGYHTSIIKTNNIYYNKNINTLEDARELIKKDLNSQIWKCSQSIETIKYQNTLETTYSIPVINFCDIPYEEITKINNVLNQMYNLFPKMKGALTNISITNANTNSEYIAFFQPMFQFVNPNKDIDLYNKVNKTQILLNSYYFLNEEIINHPITDIVGEEWYVNDATWESTIAHELGHYITFTIFLRENGLENITFVTKENENKINNILKQFDSGYFSTLLLAQALNNYNQKYHENLNLNEFALSISKYANTLDKNNNLVADETIAEAIHDYYLHKENCATSSLEIVKIIQKRL